MSKDLSMFKKMKERITDEVNSASSRLSDMQIIDQLASSLGQQKKTDLPPNQLLPELNQPSISIQNPSQNQFSFMDGPNPSEEVVSNEEEELNHGQLSPEDNLFDGLAIKKNMERKSPNSSGHIDLVQEQMKLNGIASAGHINLGYLNSDIDEDIDDDLKHSKTDESEVDLLSDCPASLATGEDIVMPGTRVKRYKSKYRDAVHALRKVTRDLEGDRTGFETERSQLLSQIAALKSELDNQKQQHDSLLSVSTSASDNDKNANSGGASPQTSVKAGNKLKDSERLIAKCKESLKAKNAQIESLKESLADAEKYKDINEDLKRELQELRDAQETWTVSIAENKRVMHQEIENKNGEIDKLKKDISDLNGRIVEGGTNIRKLKSTIQELESRLVSTSAAHQKERESLSKELTMAKNRAIQQLKKEHEHDIERVKLDLEKTIEGLKADLLSKDEKIVQSVAEQQRLDEENKILTSAKDEATQRLNDQLKILEELGRRLEQEAKSTSDLQSQLDEYKSRSVDEGETILRNKELSSQIEELTSKLDQIRSEDAELKIKIGELSKSKDDECESCAQYRQKIAADEDKFQQELHELTTRLQTLATANEDQEKEIQVIRSENSSIKEAAEATKVELEKQIKANENLSNLMRDNEADLQSQQEQLERLTNTIQELDNYKRETSSLTASLSTMEQELSERNAESLESKRQASELLDKLASIKSELSSANNLVEKLRRERDDLIRAEEAQRAQRKETEQQIVLRIVSAMKNLETPTSSPCSDKSSGAARYSALENPDKPHTDLVSLMNELSSLALDRCNAYVTANHRLDAVLVNNRVISEEIARLKEELNSLTREREEDNSMTLKVIEHDKLQSEHLALRDRLRQQEDASLKQSEAMSEMLRKIDELETQLRDAQQQMSIRQDNGEESEVPDPMQYEYLKNIVYQFMLGKEPLVLARVISAVFKFEKSQIDQICKYLESRTNEVSNGYKQT